MDATGAVDDPAAQRPGIVASGILTGGAGDRSPSSPPQDGVAALAHALGPCRHDVFALPAEPGNRSGASYALSLRPSAARPA
jgi:hypothetical protein